MQTHSLFGDFKGDPFSPPQFGGGEGEGKRSREGGNGAENAEQKAERRRRLGRERKDRCQEGSSCKVLFLLQVCDNSTVKHMGLEEAFFFFFLLRKVNFVFHLVNIYVIVSCGPSWEERRYKIEFVMAEEGIRRAEIPVNNYKPLRLPWWSSGHDSSLPMQIPHATQRSQI